jgi:Zn-dependent protease with chaperone function
MDFFGSQDAARRKTGILVVYFVVAVVLMILTLYVAAVGTLILTHAKGGHASRGDVVLWQPKILLLVAGGTLAIITLGSLFKTFQLRAGGVGIAEQLGGRRLHGNSRDPLERRLLNVVEEMALAAGTPVPPVYLLDNEPGINAFAAGFMPGDAVIGVNRGTVEHLSRDELQGVIAHEFSHILNGDMRLNLRLMGLLHGILLIAIIGCFLIRGGAVGGHRSSDRRGKGGGQIVLIGLAMLIIGYVGLFFARLIKAAVSRQREYLADASAVQFTRNPDGIAGALKNIGALSAGSQMETAEAESASHLFFGSFRKSLFQSLSTHPPLVERIQRVDPHFDGDFAAAVARKAKRKPPKKKKEDPKTAFEGLTRPLGGLAAAGMGNRIPVDPVVVIAAVGAPTTQHVDYAHGLLDRLPDALRDALHDPFSCRAVVAALLLDRDAEIRARQLQIVKAKLGDLSHQETNQLAPLVEMQGVAARLPLVEIAKSTLQDLSPSQYQTLRETVIELVKADVKIDLFEFALQRVLVRRLDQHFHGYKPPRVLYPAIGGVKNEVSNLISALSHLGHADEAEAKAAFEQASAAFAAEKMLMLRSRGECSLKQIDESLDKLAQSSAAVKKRVLYAATVSVMADGVITTAEGELLRAIADSLDCPMPPLLGAEAASDA